MKIWLFNASEGHAFAGTSQRPGRATMQARALRARGHEVHWFSSAFDHASKSWNRSLSPAAAQAEGIHLHLLRGCGYRRNVSLARVVDHALLRHGLRKAVAALPPPDLILCSYPIIEFAVVAAELANRHRVPLIIDVRDWWPDIFRYGARPWQRGFVAPFVSYYQRSARWALSQATGLMGITEEFVDWAAHKAGRPRGPWDRAFPLCFPESRLPSAALQSARSFWDASLAHAPARPIFAFLGTLGHSLDVDPLIDAALQFGDTANDPLFVLCGVGDRLAAYRARAAGRRNLLLPGWVDRSQGQALLERSYAGLNPLPLRPDFLASINGKTAEYLAASLPIVSSPCEGSVHRLLQSHGCGLSYDPTRPGDAVQVLRGFLADSPARDRMALAARRVYETMFVAERVFDQMAAHLECVVRSAVR